MAKPHTRISASQLHSHRAGDAEHRHYFDKPKQKTLIWALALTLLFALVEAVAGVWANSLALVSDAGHMVTDSAALGLALLAHLLARRPPSDRNSFGFGRAEALAAFCNALLMLALVAWIVITAIGRLSAPHQVQGEAVVLVATLGLLINLAVAWVLARDQNSINTKAALVHVIGDLLGSVAALIAGGVIYLTGWMQIDPLLSILVALLILKSTLSILASSYHSLMEGVPSQIDYLQVGADLMQVGGVLSVHDLHIWEMSPGQPALIGHVEIRDLQEWPNVLRAIKAMLLTQHGIDHVTLQAETPGMAE